MRFAVKSMLASAAACAGFVSIATTADTPTVSFSNDVIPLLKHRCVSCHLSGTEAGKIALHAKVAYANLVNQPSTESGWLRVKPGAPNESYLMMKLDGTHLDAGGKGSRMPFGGQPLDEIARQKIRDWIASGAPNN